MYTYELHGLTVYDVVIINTPARYMYINIVDYYIMLCMYNIIAIVVSGIMTLHLYT